MKRPHGVTRPILTAAQKRVRAARRALAARGLVEAVTWSFGPRSHAELFGGGGAALVLANPIAADLDCMRPGLLPGLIAALKRNVDRGFADLALFEVGPAYAGDAPEDQRTFATGLRRGAREGPGSARHWSGGAPPTDVFCVKADALAALDECGIADDILQTVAEAPAWYHPGRSGSLKLGPHKTVAAFGEIHPRVLDTLDVAGPIVAFEIDLDALPPMKPKPTKTRPALDSSDLPPVVRDFAFVVGDEVTAEALMRAARGADKMLISEVSLFDVFAGRGIPEGKKSLAVAVTLQPRDKTLTDAEIEAVSRRIVAAVEKATGGMLRAV